MGEERRRREMREAAATELEPKVKQVTHALQRMCTATSQHLGRDCYLHTRLAHVLLADLGVQTQIQAGYAAWRVSEEDQAVVAHAPEADQMIEDDPDRSLLYHAWLVHNDLIIDVTLYQLERKVRELDQVFGGHTHIRWSPDYVIVRPEQIRTIEELGRSYRPGDLYYARRPRVEELLKSGNKALDPEDLAMARMVLAHPQALVYGLFSEQNR